MSRSVADDVTCPTTPIAQLTDATIALGRFVITQVGKRKTTTEVSTTKHRT